MKIDDIILAEIDKNQLTIYTTDKILSDTLTNFQHRLIVVIFYRYPRCDEYRLGIAIDSFSGNMIQLTWSKNYVSRNMSTFDDYLGV